MEVSEILKVYGPLGMGWVVAIYLGRFILARYDKDLETKLTLAQALIELTEHVRELR